LRKLDFITAKIRFTAPKLHSSKRPQVRSSTALQAHKRKMDKITYFLHALRLFVVVRIGLQLALLKNSISSMSKNIGILNFS